MPWYAVHEISTGRLISTGTVVADDAELAKRGLASTLLAFNPQVETKRWNDSNRNFDNIPLRKLILTTREFLNNLTPTEREALFEDAKVQKRTNAFLEYIKLTNIVDPNDNYIVGEIANLEATSVIGTNKLIKPNV